MDIITYEQPEENIRSNLKKPVPQANKPFPYNHLADDRRFEELLYTLINAKIKAGSFPGYDKIMLMTGVRDKGRDCTLSRDGKNYGLIQCKKYQGNLNKQSFGLEITKYVLYSLIFPELIAEPDDFTYYIAVSSGFTSECSSFIDDFKMHIQVEADLEVWINKIMHQPTLSPLLLDDAKEQKVRNILTRIKVETILPQDLDAYLSEPACSYLQFLFFEVRSVVDSASLYELTKKLDSFINGELNKDEIKDELERSSHSLKFEVNEFDNIPGSHIKRDETLGLMNWIESPAEKDSSGNQLNICLLAGNAGMGKTVILKDLYEELEKKRVAVLGLKADKLYASSIKELQQKIGLSIPIHNFIEQCKKQYPQVILIIDQIDALSQSMAADRSFLTVYKSVIDKYKHDPDVRIIISIRIFDLEYDPSLRIYKNIRTVKVSLLSEEQVVGHLTKIGIAGLQLNSKLLQLLRVPNHLNIFTRISYSYSTEVPITNAHDLYSELWKQKVIIKPSFLGQDPSKVKKLLFELAAYMFSIQKISVNETRLEEYHKEYSYLASERIIKQEGSDIQFFHQSFYDFVFARHFVENGEDVVAFVKDHEQSIMIRSALKMIVNFMRDYDEEQYLKILQSLLADKDILFHIKHMLISMLAFADDPSEAEMQILINTIASSLTLSSLFFEYANDSNWFDKVVESGMLRILELENEPDKLPFDDISLDAEKLEKEITHYRSMARDFIVRFLHKGLEQVWTFLTKVKDKAVLRSILYYLNNWDNESAFKLFESCNDFSTVDRLTYFHILAKIALKRPEYAWLKYEEDIDVQKESDRNSPGEISLLKTLLAKIPKKMIATLLNTIEGQLTTQGIPGIPLIYHEFTNIDLNDKNSQYRFDLLYWLLAQCLRSTANNGDIEFQVFAEKYKTSNQKALLRLLIFALKTNEEKCPELIFNLFCYFRDLGYLKKGEDFSIEFRELFEAGFSHFNANQQANVVSSLKNLKNKEEIFISRFREKPRLWTTWGLGKYLYLLRLPTAVIMADMNLKRILQELQRRFGEQKEESRLGNIAAGIVRRPVAAFAHAKMTKEHWILSFRRYDKENDRFSDDYLKGGISEHSWAFREYASTPSEKIIDIVRTIIEDESIPVIYPIMGLWGLAIGQTNKDILLELFKRLRKYRDCQKEMGTLVAIAAYLLGDEDDDPEVIQMVIDQSKNFEDKKGDALDTKDVFMNAINSLHGSAAQVLCSIRNPAMEDDVFGAVEYILENGPPESRAALYSKFANLNILNNDRAYQLFSKAITLESDVNILSTSIWSLQYMGNYDFAKLSPVFEKLVKSTELGEPESHNLFALLFYRFLYNKPEAEPLLYILLSHNIHIGSYALRKILKYFYHKEDSPELCRVLLLFIISISGVDKREHLQHIDLGSIAIKDIFIFLEAYIGCPAFIFNYNLLKYITEQCTSSPVDCIYLFDLAIKKLPEGDMDGIMLYDYENVAKFIVGAFSALKDNDELSRQHRIKLLSSFDVILKDHRFRTNTDKILEELL